MKVPREAVTPRTKQLEWMFYEFSHVQADPPPAIPPGVTCTARVRLKRKDARPNVRISPTSLTMRTRPFLCKLTPINRWTFRARFIRIVALLRNSVPAFLSTRAYANTLPFVPFLCQFLLHTRTCVVWCSILTFRTRESAREFSSPLQVRQVIPFRLLIFCVRMTWHARHPESFVPNCNIFSVSNIFKCNPGKTNDKFIIS